MSLLPTLTVVESARRPIGRRRLPFLCGWSFSELGHRFHSSHLNSAFFFVIFAACMDSYQTPFWALPTTILNESAAAASVGLIHSLGSLGVLSALLARRNSYFAWSNPARCLRHRSGVKGESTEAALGRRATNALPGGAIEDAASNGAIDGYAAVEQPATPMERSDRFSHDETAENTRAGRGSGHTRRRAFPSDIC
jgi:hypothetical protein